MRGRSPGGRGVSAHGYTGGAPRANGIIALAFVGIVMVAPASARAGTRTSCPLATGANPFATTTLAQYELTFVDGGPGDLDGVANGTCEIEFTSCAASGECDGEELTAVRVRTRGGGDKLSRAETAQSVVVALAGLVGATLVDDTTIAFQPAPPPGACGRARLRLAAVTSGKRAPVAVTISADVVDDAGRETSRRITPKFRCVAADRGDTVPTCRAFRRRCPDASGAVCGEGRRAGDEACDGADDAMCPGACRADCSCPAQVTVRNVAPQASVRPRASAQTAPARRPSMAAWAARGTRGSRTGSPRAPCSVWSGPRRSRSMPWCCTTARAPLTTFSPPPYCSTTAKPFPLARCRPTAALPRSCSAPAPCSRSRSSSLARAGWTPDSARSRCSLRSVRTIRRRTLPAIPTRPLLPSRARRTTSHRRATTRTRGRPPTGRGGRSARC